MHFYLTTYNGFTNIILTEHPQGKKEDILVNKIQSVIRYIVDSRQLNTI